MTERGHKCYLFCVEGSPIHQNAEGVDVVLINRNKKSFDRKNAKIVRKKLESLKVDVLWYNDKRDLSLVALVKAKMKDKIRTLYQQCMQIGIDKKEWWHTARFKRIDYWVTPLNYLKTQVGERTKFDLNKVHVIHQGLDMDAFVNAIPERSQARKHFNLKEDDLVVGMIGRIDFAKAQRFVMDVVSDMQKDHPHLKMLMVGNKTEGEWEEYYNDIVSEIETNHSDASIQLYPFMKDVGTFYSAIDIFVMASKNETYGMVTIESMISGNVIAGTQAAGTEELLNDGQYGYYFNWQDADSLKLALQAILDNPDKAQQKAIDGKDYARGKFSYQSELDQIESLFSDIQ